MVERTPNSEDEFLSDFSGHLASLHWQGISSLWVLAYYHKMVKLIFALMPRYYIMNWKQYIQ